MTSTSRGTGQLSQGKTRDGSPGAVYFYTPRLDCMTTDPSCKGFEGIDCHIVREPTGQPHFSNFKIAPKVRNRSRTRRIDQGRGAQPKIAQTKERHPLVCQLSLKSLDWVTTFVQRTVRARKPTKSFRDEIGSFVSGQNVDIGLDFHREGPVSPRIKLEKQLCLCKKTVF